MKDFIGVVDDLKYVFLSLIGILGGALILWVKRSKAGLTVNADTQERQRLNDAMANERAAIAEAGQLRVDMGAVQRRLGHLEAENDACNRRTDELALQVKELREDNRKQAEQIAHLMRKKTVNPTASDFRPS